VKYLLKRGVQVWLESSLHIKRSIGLTRGKDDKVDSERIATYAYMHQHKAELVSVDQHNLDRINYLMKGKVRLEKSLTSLQTAIREMKSLDEKAGKELEMVSKSAFLGLKKSIEKTKDRIAKVIESDTEVKALFDLITSVKSVGKVLATEVIVYTHGFNRLLDAKKLACYSGVATFPHSSGTSVNGKVRVCHFSNKALKKNAAYVCDECDKI
jgi:transposase